MTRRDERVFSGRNEGVGFALPVLNALVDRVGKIGDDLHWVDPGISRAGVGSHGGMLRS